MYAFSQTVIGFSHIQSNRACEDCSDSYTDSDGRYYIAAVADGHGDKRCFRSAFGSKTAVDTAIKNLKAFADVNLSCENSGADNINSLCNDPRFRQMSIKQLTDCILAEWSDRVINDYQTNPPSPEEIGDVFDDSSFKDNIPHIYGTTLIAALMLSECLIIIHQGDGRCDVFYDDGTVDQPVPWDKRCEGTSTTSLCDTDASVSFRSAVINTSKKRVAACCMGSDGVEDAFRDTYEDLGGSHELMGGVHTFYKELLCDLAESSAEDFKQHLGELLPEFSKIGSGDDVSVAGIVDLNAIKALAEKYSRDVKVYNLDETLFQKQAELNSKKRKHELLQKRVIDSEKKLNQLNAEYAKGEEEKSLAFQDLEKSNSAAEKAKARLEEFKADSDAEGIRLFFQKHFSLGNNETQLDNERRMLERQYQKLEDEKQKSAVRLRDLIENQKKLAAEITAAKAVMEKAKEEFSSFDAVFRSLESDIMEITKQKSQPNSEVTPKSEE